MWTWCLYTGGSQKLRWIHIPRLENEIYVVDFNGDGGLISYKIRSDKYMELFPNDGSINLIIIDGATLDTTYMQRHAFSWYKGSKSSRLIIVTSLQAEPSGESLMLYNTDGLRLEGWTNLEYEIVCQNEDFYNSILPNLDADPDAITREERLESKIYIAGSSARWMFNMDSEKVTKDIERHINKVISLNDLIRGFAGYSSSAAVNHLVTLIDGKGIIVSQYTAKLFASRIEYEQLASITRYSRVLPNYQAFDGWVFQLDVLFQLRNALETRRPLAFSNSSETWQANYLREFYRVNDLQISGFEDHSWLIPLKPNQGCFDALQLLSQPCGILRAVQITLSQRQSLKLKHVVVIISRLKALGFAVNKLDIVIVRPSYMHDEVAITVTDDKVGPIASIGWDKTMIRQLQITRTGLS